jgi:hypothetical protein
LSRHTSCLSELGLRYGVPILLLLLMFAQISSSITATSLTIDEGLHITSGYSILRTGDYRLIEEHPPLVKLIAAWPLLLVPDLTDPRQLPAWESDVALTDSVRLVQVTQGLIYDYQPLDRLVSAARLPIAMLAVMLGAVAFRWASDRFGPKGGALTLFLLAFDPNILAHAGVAATDVGAACFILIALFTFQRYLYRPSAARWALAGVALGLAQGAKLSALLLLPVQGLLVLIYPLLKTGQTPRESRWRVLARSVSAYAGMLVLAALVLWALYGFDVGPAPGLDVTLPAPSHLIPWLRLRGHLQGGHAAFLMGKVSHQGWWYYFPAALLLKTPLPILLSWLGGLAVLVLGGRRRALDEMLLLLFPLVYLFASLRSNLNIGYRHLLPVLPLLAIFAGRLAGLLDRRVEPLPSLKKRMLLPAVTAGLGLWLVGGTASVAPHFLAYFNELAGGPDGGYRYLVDSNTDWGQALKALARYQQENDIPAVFLSMFTFLDPSIYGVRYRPLTPMLGNTPAVFPSRFDPPPGVYVISTTTLQGIPLADPEMFDWFRHREPDARIAHVMFLYRVPEETKPGEWVAQCLVPGAPLPPDAIAEGFGRPDLRRAYFDCTRSWLIPQGGQASGWWVLSRDTAGQENSFLQSLLARARVIYEQQRPRAIPPFVVYRWSGKEIIGEDSVKTGTVAPSAWSPRRAETDGARVSAPVPLEGGPEWLGYKLDRTEAHAGQTVELQTFWRVTQIPAEPVSLMAHLIAEDGRAVAVGDGLGVPIENWQVGDVIIQRHLLEIPPDTATGTYWVQIGVYTTADLRRLGIASDAQPSPGAGDRLLLERVEVVR